MSDSRIYVRLSKEEFDALYNAAMQDYRKPADQARHILRTALTDQMKHNDAGLTVKGETGAVVTAG